MTKPKKDKGPNVKLNVDINATVEMSWQDYKDWLDDGIEAEELESSLMLSVHDTVHNAWITSVDFVSVIERY